MNLETAIGELESAIDRMNANSDRLLMLIAERDQRRARIDAMQAEYRARYGKCAICNRKSCHH